MNTTKLAPSADLAQPHAPIDQTPYDRSILLAVAVFSAFFLAAAIRLDSHRQYWMDEVLAVWIARLPNTAAIWSAIYHGGEFSPPTYHLLLHALGQIAGFSKLVLRLPSILATFLVGVCTFILLRRYFDVAAAAFGMVFLLLGILPAFGLDARPYALVTACFSIAMLLWDDLDHKNLYLLRVSAITLLLIAAICLHFYAVLLIACFGLMELRWSIAHRRIRFAPWIGMVAAGLSLAAWLPLMKALGHYNSGDTASPFYYARPSLAGLSHLYPYFFIFGSKQTFLLLITVFLFVIAYGLQSAGFFAPAPSSATPARGRATNLYIIAVATVIFPVVVFVFAALVTKTFNARYCLITPIGLALLAAIVFHRLPAASAITAPLVLLSSALALIGSSQTGFAPVFVRNQTGFLDYQTDYLSLLAAAPASSPIVIADGLEYFQLTEAAPASLKGRLVYVSLPVGLPAGDATNQHQVERWAAIRPDLRIYDAATFFRKYPHFSIFLTNTSSHVMTDWLLHQGLIGKPLAIAPDALLLAADAPK